MELEHSLTPHIKISSKQIEDLNVGRTLSDINRINIFLDPFSRIVEIKTKINKRVLNKLKIFGTAKDTINKVKR